MDEPRLFDLNIEKILEAWGTTHAVRELISNVLNEHALARKINQRLETCARCGRHDERPGHRNADGSSRATSDLKRHSVSSSARACGSQLSSFRARTRCREGFLDPSVPQLRPYVFSQKFLPTNFRMLARSCNLLRIGIKITCNRD